MAAWFVVAMNTMLMCTAAELHGVLLLAHSWVHNVGVYMGCQKCLAVTVSLFKHNGVSCMSHFINLNVSHVHLYPDFEIVQKMEKSNGLNFLRRF